MINSIVILYVLEIYVAPKFRVLDPLTPTITEIVGALGNDHITRQQISIIAKRKGIEISWITRRNGPVRYLILLSGVPIAIKFEEELLAIEEINANVLGLAYYTSCDRYFSLPKMSKTTKIRPTISTFKYLHRNAYLFWKRAKESPYYQNSVRERGLPIKYAFSWRRIAEDYALDVFIEFASSSKSIAHVRRLQVFSKTIIDSGWIDYMPRSYADGLYSQDVKWNKPSKRKK